MQLNRGDLWQCPFCGYLFPVIEDDKGIFIPVQADDYQVLQPIANIQTRNGTPTIVDLRATIEGSRFRSAPALIPHQYLCKEWAIAWETTPPVGKAAGPPPPPCQCGCEWVDHMHHEVGKIGGSLGFCKSVSEFDPDVCCGCQAYVEVEPEEPEEPGPKLELVKP